MFRGCERAVQQIVEEIRLKDDWLKRDGKEIQEFFKTFAIA